MIAKTVMRIRVSFIKRHQRVEEIEPVGIYRIRILNYCQQKGHGVCAVRPYI